jgi:hypothetical protein
VPLVPGGAVAVTTVCSGCLGTGIAVARDSGLNCSASSTPPTMSVKKATLRHILEM